MVAASFSSLFRDALITGLPLFNGCAACPDRLASWRERRSRLPVPDFCVDFVFTWVDGADPLHAAKRSRYFSKMEQGEDGASHYRDNGELRYALRSLEAYAPWAHRVFLVTDGQIPAWLKADHPKIRVVDHTECIPSPYLPTFSSRVIEAHLHRISDLAEHYVYCNDDFFLLSPCRPEDFFTANGLPYLFTDWKQSRREGYARADTPHAASYANTRAWLESHGFVPAPDVITAHVPYPQTKANAADAYTFYEEFIQAVGREKFRSRNGMVFTCHAVQLWAYAVKRTVPCDMPYYYLNSRRADRKIYYAAMLREKNSDSLPPFLCINDVGEAPEEHTWRKDMRDFLDAYYPEPSSFESGGPQV
jgi:hypothetical protein